MERLTQEQKVRPAIVVASWCTDKRTREYMPQAPLEQPENASLRDAFIKHFGAAPISDGYLRFLVEELKPWVDDHYRTLPDPAHTFIMGSSMGGLISLYALCRYPNVFGGAGCISTHWTIGAGLTHGFAPDGVWRIQPYHAMSNNALIAYFSAHLPAPGTHKIYFDLGTAGLDEFYPPWQVQMDAHMRTAGYTEYVNWLTNAFPGEHHNEAAWRDRVHVPLQFLLGTDSDTVKA
jgi:enterochelin esterase-like enzyme